MRFHYSLVAFSVALLGLTVLLAACSGGGGGGNSVEMKEYSFTPPTVTVKANQAVTINLRNTGTLVHDWVVQGMPGPEVKGEVQPGRSGTVTFTPTQPGTYRVICAQPAHEQSGMVGQLVVQ